MMIIYLSHYKSEMNEGESFFIKNHIFVISEHIKFTVHCTF